MRAFATLYHIIFGLFAAYQLPTLFALIMVEEIGVPLPLPGDTLIAYAGAHTGRTPLGAVEVISTVALAATLGSSLLYLLARHSGPVLIRKVSRVLHLHPERLDRLEASFRAHGAIAIVIGRLVPGLRTPTTVMAGLSGVPYRTFVPSTALAAVIWSAFYYFLGGALRHVRAPFLMWIQREPDQAWSAFALLVGIMAVCLWYRQRRGGSRRTPVAG